MSKPWQRKLKSDIPDLWPMYTEAQHIPIREDPESQPTLSSHSVCVQRHAHPIAATSRRPMIYTKRKRTNWEKGVSITLESLNLDPFPKVKNCSVVWMGWSSLDSWLLKRSRAGEHPFDLDQHQISIYLLSWRPSRRAWSRKIPNNSGARNLSPPPRHRVNKDI